MRHQEYIWFTLFVSSFIILKCTASKDVKVRLRNDGRIRVEARWIDPKTTKAYAVGILEPFGELYMNSFLGHEFQLLELPNDSYRCDLGNKNKSLEKIDGCSFNKFKVSTPNEQNILVTDDLQIRVDDSNSISGKLSSSERLAMCRFDAKKKILKAKSGGHISNATTNRILDQLEECLAQSFVPTLTEMTNQRKFEDRVLKSVSASMENFTCTGDLAESTPDFEKRQWTSDRDNVTRIVHVKFDRPVAKIHVVEDFASIEECNAMEESVSGRLGIATTEDGKGGSRVSENRKAMQAYIEPDWSKESLGNDPILRLNRRIFDYTNHVLGLNISVHGQEPLMSIQYFGRGENDTEPDRYTAHCDGRCDGNPLIHASRMATMVIYCTIPKKGGQTNFQTAGVTVKPKRGSAVFFSYIDPLTNITDQGYTRHSGCPVFEGEKKIITQWIRLGVDAEVTYDAYNSLDVLISEDGE